MFDQAAPSAELGLAELLLDAAEFLGDDGRHALWLGQYVQQVFNFGHHLLVFGDDFVLLQPGQPLQSHLQDLLRLRFAQPVKAIAAHAEVLLQPVGAIVVSVDRAAVGAGSGEHLAHQLAVPGSVHQFKLGDRRCRRVADDGNKCVDVGQRHRKTLKHMAALARLAQGEDGAPGNDFAPVLQKHLDQVLQVAQLGLSIDQRDHVDAEGVLQLRLLVQVVEHHLGNLAAL